MSELKKMGKSAPLPITLNQQHLRPLQHNFILTLQSKSVGGISPLGNLSLKQQSLVDESN